MAEVQALQPDGLSPNTAARLVTIPYVWLALAAIFFVRAAHPAASGSIDPDVYWHLLYGHWILEHQQLPTTDMWSWTFNGAPYRLTQWLGEVSIALAERLGGETGKQIFASAVVTTTIAISYRAARSYLSNRTAAFFVVIACESLLVSMPCRPQLYTFLGLALLSWIATAVHATGRLRALLWVPPLMALWVNLHGGYAIGLAMIWLVAGAYLAEAFMSNSLATRRRVLLALIATALAGTLATLINPYGWGAWSYTFAVGSLKSVSAGLTAEWVPTSLKDTIGFAYLGVVTGMTAVMAFSRQRPTPAEAMIVLALMALGWQASRVSILVSIMLVPWMARYFAMTPLHDLAFPVTGARLDGMRHVPAAAAAVAIAAMGIYIGTHDTHTERRVRADFPVEEAAFMREHGLSTRVMNTMEAGGYLISKLGIPVFLDTRLDLYGDRFFFEFMDANDHGKNWQSFLAKYDPEVALLEHESALKNLMLHSGRYKAVFKGRRYVVMVKTEGMYRQLPATPI